MSSLWQWGVLLAGVGFFILSLVGCFVLLSLSGSLRELEGTIARAHAEAKLALPALRHAVQQVDEMLTSINGKVSAADRAMTATGATIKGWRERFRERFASYRGWARARARPAEEERST